MNGQQLAVAVGVVVNHAPRPPALRPIAYVKYPAREIRPVLIQDGSWRVSLALWGYEYKHRGPRAKSTSKIDAEMLQCVFNALLPHGLSVSDVEVSSKSINIYITEREEKHGNIT